MSNFVCKYYILKNDLIVTNIYDSDTSVIPEGDYAQIDIRDVVAINNELRNKKVIKIKNTDKIKNKHPLTLEDFEIEELSNLEKKRADYINKVTNSLSVMIATIQALEIFEYLETFSMFLDKGIVLTEDNREEKYLEVINTGDEVLLDRLEKHLEVKDKVKKISNFYKRCQETLENIRNAKTEKELDEIFTVFKDGSK